MVRRLLAATLACAMAASVLFGCAPRSLPTLQPAAPQADAPLLRWAPEGPEPSTQPVVEAGLAPAEANDATLNLTIRWPRPGAASYGVAALPLSANSVRFSVSKAGSILDSKLVPRLPGAETATASFRLPATSNAMLSAAAYAEADPDLETAVPIASGVSAPFTLVRSKFSTVALTLVPAFPPVVTSLTSPFQGEEDTQGTYYAAEGDTLVITGENFATGSTPVVIFNRTDLESSGRVAASEVIWDSETQLRVKVPPKAATGRITVVVDGIAAQSPSSLWIPTVSIDAPKQAFDSLPAGMIMVPDDASYTGNELPHPIPGSTITLTATVGWAMKPGDSVGQFGTPPLPTVNWLRTSEWAGSYTKLDRYRLFFSPRPLASGTEYFQTGVTAQVGSATSNALALVIVDVCKAYPCPD